MTIDPDETPEEILLSARKERIEAAAARGAALEAQETAEHSTLVVLARLESIREDIAEVRADAKEIKEQVKATNGRVTKLELWRYGLEMVHAAHSWIRPAIVAFVSGAGLAVLGYFLSH